MDVQAHVAGRNALKKGQLTRGDDSAQARGCGRATDLNPIVGVHDARGPWDDFGFKQGFLSSAHHVRGEHMDFGEKQRSERQRVVVHATCV